MGAKHITPQRAKLTELQIQKLQLGRTKITLTNNPRRLLIRKNSISLLDPEAAAIPSLLDLTQQDFEVNAPVTSLLLQGEELLTALELNAAI